MHHSKRIFLSGFWLLAVQLSAVEATLAQETDFDAIEISATDVAPGLYFLEGNGGNIGLSVGTDGVFIIDDQFAPLTAKIKAKIAGYSDQPVKFVINSHFHFDHSDGN